MIIALPLIIAITIIIGGLLVVYGITEDDFFFMILGVALICISLVAVFEVEEMMHTPLNETEALNLTESWECVEWEHNYEDKITCYNENNSVAITPNKLLEPENICPDGFEHEKYIYKDQEFCESKITGFCAYTLITCTKYMKVGVRVQ